MPTISIIIPAYNAEQTIIKTIESVQKQTFTDYEIIVIDDGSTDRTKDVVSKIEDRRLKILTYQNAGAATARNRGIAQATGKYLAFIDADDLWTSDKLELQLEALQKNPTAGVAYSWTTSVFLYKQKEVWYPCNPVLFEGNVYPKMLLGNFIASGSNPLIRQEAILSVGGFDSDLLHCEDWDFYLRLAAKWEFVLVPKSQIIYRLSLTSKSLKTSSIEKSLLYVVDKAYKTAPEELQSSKKKTLALAYAYITQQCLFCTKDICATDIKEVERAAQRLWKAIELDPPILLGSYARGLLKGLIRRWLQARWLQVRLNLFNF